MNESPLLGLAHNISLLLALVLVFDTVGQRMPRGLALLRQIPIGLLIGAIGVAVMLTPWVLTPGAIFDTRSVLLAISGLFFGTLPTVIAMTITAAFRIYLGGSGALTGVLVILATGSMGIVWRRVRKQSLEKVQWRELYLFGLLTHLVMLVLMLTFPWEIAKSVLTNISLPVLVIYPLGTALLGKLISNRLRRDKIQDVLYQTTIRLNATQRLTKMGGWEWDVVQQSMFWTDEVYRIHGFSLDDIPPGSTEHIQKSLSYYEPADRPIIQAAFQNCAEKGLPYDLELPFTTVADEQIWIRTQAEAVLDEGKIVRVLGSLMDITERKRAEAQILRLNTELEQRVNERTAQLEAVNREMEAFSYSVSHDLRAPLRAMSGFSGALLEDYRDKLDADGRQYLTRIQEASRQMAQLIEDLINLSRITRHEVNSSCVNLSSIARQIADELQRQSPDRQVEFEIDHDIVVFADPNLLKIALENLLRNAFKFTGKRTLARIQFGARDQNGTRTYFVRDNGAGFDMANASKLFTPFQRLHGAREYPGTGIGLTIVQRIITRHGGRIWPEAAVEQGATFYFTLGGN